MIKLFIYPTARPHSHDLDTFYYNTTPMSIEGIKQYFTVVSDPTQADFFYCGQISDGTLYQVKREEFTYLEGLEHKHIVTIEGDWVNESIPEYLLNCIFTGNNRN